MILAPEGAWGKGLDTWLRVYSDYVRVRAATDEDNNRDFFVIDTLALTIGDALEEEYPQVDPIALLRAQVRVDADVPLGLELLAAHEDIRRSFDDFHSEILRGSRPWR